MKYHSIDFLNTRSEPSNLIKLAKFYNVSVDYLIGLTDTRNEGEIYKELSSLDAGTQNNILELIKRLKK